MRRLAIIAAAGSFAAFGSSALAQDADPAIDTDGDGTYSMEELQAAHADLTEETFNEIDTNADGSVDPAEYQAALDAGTITETEG